MVRPSSERRGLKIKEDDCRDRRGVPPRGQMITRARSARTLSTPETRAGP
jgi:hypothetical protein